MLCATFQSACAEAVRQTDRLVPTDPRICPFQSACAEAVRQTFAATASWETEEERFQSACAEAVRQTYQLNTCVLAAAFQSACAEAVRQTEQKVNRGRAEVSVRVCGGGPSDLVIAAEGGDITFQSACAEAVRQTPSEAVRSADQARFSPRVRRRSVRHYAKVVAKHNYHGFQSACAEAVRQTYPLAGHCQADPVSA